MTTGGAGGTVQANAVTLISGPSGSGKTSLVATAAEYVWRKHKKKTRLYVADGGGFGTRMEALVLAGIVQVWRMRTRVGAGAEGLIEETCARASQGWWPAEIEPASGNTREGIGLVPPTLVVWTMKCVKGHVVKRGRAQKDLTPTQCSACKTLVTLQNGSVEKDSALAPGFEHVGLVAYDGVTSMSGWILMALADRTGRLELQGEKSALGRIQSGEMVFGGNNRSHYGFAQTQAEKWILNSTAIPGLVEPPIWTALETKMEETGISAAYYGPSVAGQAATGRVPQWVGNYMGTQIVIDEKGEKHWRVYLTEYRGDDGIPHKYKMRAEPGALPEFLEDAKGAESFSTFNLGVIFTLLEEARLSSVKRIQEAYPDAPGLGSGRIEVPKVESPAAPEPPKAVVAGPVVQTPRPAPPPVARPVTPAVPAKAPMPGPQPAPARPGPPRLPVVPAIPKPKQ